MLNSKKIFCDGLGLTINEIKKSYLLSVVFMLILFGLCYFCFIISYGFYFQINSSKEAIIWSLVNLIFLLFLLMISFTILNKIKKLCLLKVINKELKNKNKAFLLFIDSFLDKEFKLTTKEKTKLVVRFLLAFLFCALLVFFLIGILEMISNIYLKSVIGIILFFLFGGFLFFSFLWSFFSKNLTELVFSYKIFTKHFGLIISTLIISLILLFVVFLIFYLIPDFYLKYILFSVLFAFVFIWVVYFCFFIISQLFLEQHK